MANTTWSNTDKTAGLTLSGGNLTVTVGTVAASNGIRSIDRVAGSKFYFEVTLTTIGATQGIGIATGGASLSSPSFFGTAFVTNNGVCFLNGTNVATGTGAFSNGQICCLAVDPAAGLIWFRNGAAGNWNNNASNNPATGVGGFSLATVGIGGSAIAAYPFLAFNNSAINSAATANFGASAFSGAVPAGFASGIVSPSVPTLYAVATQAAVEHWAMPSTAARITQVALEQWASVDTRSDPPVGLLKLTGQPLTTAVSQGSYPPVGAFGLAGFAPTLGATLGSTVPVGVLSFTGQVPAIVAQLQTTIPIGAINFTGSVPSLLSGNSLLIPKGSFSFAGSVPTPAPASSGQGLMVSVIV
jgi:hypothetical protein